MTMKGKIMAHYMMCKHCAVKYPVGTEHCPRCGRVLLERGKPFDVREEIQSADVNYGSGYPFIRVVAFILPILFLFDWSGMLNSGAEYIVKHFLIFQLFTPFAYSLSFIVWLCLLIIGLLTPVAHESLCMYFDIHDDVSRASDGFYALSVRITRAE
jgi:hypothetical protein